MTLSSFSFVLFFLAPDASARTEPFCNFYYGQPHAAACEILLQGRPDGFAWIDGLSHLFSMPGIIRPPGVRPLQWTSRRSLPIFRANGIELNLFLY